uniref:C1q domain-containing protein n=1 Tax=Magallana gigas TaxID=29159 RepID=A0A8W8M106_MAGGI|nr:uncharacterized protein LOC105331746 isoform X2 [Crassostrea gigas]
MIFSVVLVTAVFVQAISGLLNGNVHTDTTRSPDGAVFHQTLAQLVVELDKRVNDLQTKVNALETEKHDYIVKNTQLETEVLTQRLKQESLQRMFQQQNASLMSLKTEVDVCRTLSFQLNDSLQNLTDGHEKLKSNLDVVKNFTILPMKNDINNMQGHISDILAAQGSLSGNLSHAQNDLHDLYAHVHQEKPGFTAYVDGSLDATGTVILPHVYSNTGSLYDPNTGVFTADRSGLYGFYLGIECVDTGTKIVDLVRDGSLIGHAVCFPQAGLASFGSTFSVHHIEKGSKVWAKNAYDSGDIELRGKTTLSGFLISS